MKEELVQEIKNHPKYQELTTKRTRFAWTLSIIMLFIYYAFIMTIAFSPESLAIPVSEDSVISIGAHSVQTGHQTRLHPATF